MKEIIKKPWFAIVGIFIVAMIDKFIFGLLPLDARFLLHDITDWFYIAFTLLFVYAIIWNITQIIKKLPNQQKSEEAEELKHQREIERKEIDMVRKSNEILLHLIQDEHREKNR